MYTNENSYGYTPYPPKKEPDYSNMTLRQELETRFADYEQQQKELQCMKSTNNNPYSSWPNMPTGYMDKTKVNDQQLEKFAQYLKNNISPMHTSEVERRVPQMIGATYDMIKNYANMISDQTINADDYFHCKANYEATKRGKYGIKTAERLGQIKEIYDIYKNINSKNFSFNEALNDYNHDMLVNEIGRLQALSGQYANSKDGGNIFRVRGINDKY
uniref:Uncharacterized protein n=1 Tax=uncultured Alphaproteobacteria bacterium TaxID=91750 RepID=A0A6G8F212_9PROT|nr:hypothetical protein PlAlph_0780 [uncultured Alphaproteobacteria bacterium]